MLDKAHKNLLLLKKKKEEPPEGGGGAYWSASAAPFLAAGNVEMKRLGEK